MMERRDRILMDYLIQMKNIYLHHSKGHDISKKLIRDFDDNYGVSPGLGHDHEELFRILKNHQDYQYWPKIQERLERWQKRLAAKIKAKKSPEGPKKASEKKHPELVKALERHRKGDRELRMALLAQLTTFRWEMETWQKVDLMLREQALEQLKNLLEENLQKKEKLLEDFLEELSQLKSRGIQVPSGLISNFRQEKEMTFKTRKNYSKGRLMLAQDQEVKYVYQKFQEKFHAIEELWEQKNRKIKFAPKDDEKLAPVYLRDQGCSLEHGKVRRQGKTSLCYAHTASLMMEAATKGQSLAPISAYMVGLFYQGEIRKGGITCEAFEKIKTEGVCSEDQVEARIRSFLGEDSSARSRSNSKSVDLVKIHGIIEKIYQSHTGNKVKKTMKNLCQFSLLGMAQDNTLFADQNEILDGLLKEEGEKTLAGFVSSIFGCPPSKRIYPQTDLNCREVERVRNNKYDNELFWKLINRQLDDGIPVGISLCSNFLKGDDDFRGIRPYSAPNEERFIDDCGGHVVTVIGRKRDASGNWAFIVANTWNSSCKNLPSTRECVNREFGDVAISAKALIPNLKSIHFLTKDPADQ